MILLIVGETGADALGDRLDTDPERLCSPMPAWETVAGLCRSHRLGGPQATAHAWTFPDVAGFTPVAIGPRELELATDACDRFGKGGHPAALNMGNCFASACAKGNHAVLLYKGSDFSRTDLGWAPAANPPGPP